MIPLRIALCDDDSSSLKLLNDFIQAYGREYDIELITEHFRSGEDLLAIENIQAAYDIIFMDIYLTGLDGTDVIRRLNPSRHQQIVFTTTSREHAVEAFGLNATHYLVKPLTKQLVSEAMNRCMEQLDMWLSDVLEVKTKQGLVSVPIENIIYIEVSNKISIIHTAKNCFQTYASLDSLSEMVDGNIFIRAQRSYLVNMKYIDEFLFDRIIVTGDIEIMLSRNNRAALKQQYQQFLFHLARRGNL